MRENKALSCVGLIVLFVVAIVASSAMNGWALSVMWGWFVIPVFGLPPLSVVAAIGISMVVRMMTWTGDGDNDSGKSSQEKIITAIAKAFISPLITLAIGYIVHSFM